jgi:hypothetical protein
VLSERQKAADYSASPESNRLLGELQRLFVIEKTFSRKEIAARMGLSVDCLDRWINGQREFPARLLSSLYRALGGYVRLWSCLLEDTNLTVMPRPRTKTRQPEAVMKDLLRQFGEVYRIFTKLMFEEPLTRGDILALEEEVNRAKAALDEALMIARIQQKEQERKQ